jgi:hypothetical protein
LSHLAESRRYHAKVTLALILTMVTAGGVEQQTRQQVKDMLHKTNIHELEMIVPQESVFEIRGSNFYLTDLAICFAECDTPQLLINVSKQDMQ